METSENVESAKRIDGNTAPRRAYEFEETEEESKKVKAWFDKELQACLIEIMAKGERSDEEWLILKKPEKENLKLQIIMQGFSAWYRDNEVAASFVRDPESLGKILKCYKEHGTSVATDGGSKEEKRHAMMRDFSGFIGQVKGRYEDFQKGVSRIH